MIKQWRVLIINNDLVIGGSNVLLTNLSSYFKDSSKYVFYYSLIGKKKTTIEMPNGKRKIIDGGYVNLKTLGCLASFIRKHQISLIHAHSPATYFLGIILSIVTRSKILIHVHGSLREDVENNHLFKRLARLFFFKFFVNHFVVVCQPLAKELCHDYFIKNKKITLVENGIQDMSDIPTDTKIKQELLAKYNLENNLVIIAVGRLTKVKNHCLLVEAAKRIKKETDFKFKVLLVGEGPLREKLKKQIRQNHLDQDVYLTGAFSHDKIKTIISLADIFTLTSLYEGTSISLLEALSLGIPSVVSDVGGNKQVINNKAGVVFESNNVDDLTNKLIGLMKNDQLRAKISYAGRKRFLKKYNASSTATKILSLYDNLLLPSR